MTHHEGVGGGLVGSIGRNDVLLRLVFRHMPGTVWAVDRSLCFTYAMGRLVDGAGIATKDMVGTTVQDFLGTRDPAEPGVAHHLAALAGQPQCFDYEYRGRWYAVLIDPLKLGDGSIVGCVGAAVDVTERRRVQERLALSESRLAEAQRTAHIGSFEWDAVTNTVTGTDELRHILGLESGQTVQTMEAYLARVHPDDVGPTHKALVDAGAGGPFEYRNRIVRGDGRILSVPLLIHDEVAGAITFAAPVRRRYASEDMTVAEELARRAALSVDNATLYRRAQEALHTRDELLSIAAHEIRGPLTAIHLAAQSIRKGKASPASIRNMLAVVEREDRRLSRFVEELLDMGRFREGRFQLQIEPVSLSEVVQEVVRRLDPDLVRSGSSLSVVVEEIVVGKWDRFRLEQVVTNLVSNAIKYGLGRPIEVRIRAEGGQAFLTVTDHGIGIQPQVIPRLFRPFERGVSERHYGGLGLGLHIVKTIVEAMRGSVTVTVESSPGEGTTFVASCRREKAKRMIPNERILLVDDDDDIREVMQDVLASEGYQVDVARDGAEALAKLPGATPPCLILLDMMMPNMDGETFLQALRSKPQMADAQVVVVSGSAGIREKATAMDVAACLVKPFELDELLGVVRRLTEGQPPH